jgi:serine/threonine protein kinase
VSDRGQAKLSDLGISVMIYGTEAYTRHGHGTFAYMAPELLDPDLYQIPEEQQCKSTQASDLYALGVTIWEVRLDA